MKLIILSIMLIALPGLGEERQPPSAPTSPGETVTKGKLGRQTNPVRCDGALGQRAYLDRLRDYSDQPVSYKRSGTHPGGPYGNALDSYTVAYHDGYSQEVFMDMYHPGFVEKEPPPGFKIVPPPAEAKP